MSDWFIGMSLPSTRRNHLVNEKSPYLQQHSGNPVDWYPWGAEAFEEARRRDVPVFLSVGYSTCHWCHVMAHESFEDGETARALNEAFVCVKVDREERPDIDAAYMKVCQMLTGGGGWPLTILMTAEREPFFAGTYLPKKSRGGMLGLVELIERVSELWRMDRYRLVSDAASNVEALSQINVGSPRARLDATILDSAYRQLASIYNEEGGGFGRAPKFPSPHNLMFLLRYWRRSAEPHAFEMVSNTLQKMASGGIRDHVGGGFHRYSTDSKWLIPHFEKMLYDQATLILAYVEAFQASADPAYSDVAREIADYTLRVLRSPEGGFYSAEDADSEGEEGRFYTWTRRELSDVLGEDEATLAIEVFSVSDGGNFSERPGASVLSKTVSPDRVAARFSLGACEYLGKVKEIVSKLREARERRPHPLLDDKILTDWNGLMIAALARAGSILGEGVYLEAAVDAARFIKERMFGSLLYHRYRLGESAIPGFLDDYAYLAWGLLELYEATFDVEYIEWAKALVDEAIRLFQDVDQGGFYLSRSSEGPLPLIKDVYDGAKPSGNSVMAMNLVRLGRIFGDGYEVTAEKLIQAIASEVESNSSAYSYLLCSLDYYFGPSFEVVIAGEYEKAKRVVREFRRSYSPNKILMIRTPGLEKLLEYTLAMRTSGGNLPYIYVKTGHVAFP